jgi:hypothetical protein
MSNDFSIAKTKITVSSPSHLLSGFVRRVSFTFNHLSYTITFRRGLLQVQNPHLQPSLFPEFAHALRTPALRLTREADSPQGADDSKTAITKAWEFGNFTTRAQYFLEITRLLLVLEPVLLSLAAQEVLIAHWFVSLQLSLKKHSSKW